MASLLPHDNGLCHFLGGTSSRKLSLCQVRLSSAKYSFDYRSGVKLYQLRDNIRLSSV